VIPVLSKNAFLKMKAMLRKRGAGLLFAGFALLFSGLLHGQTAGDFRTNGNVDFVAAANWERHNGTSFVPAGSAPVLGDGVITILNTHTASVTGDITLDQLVVDAGGVLTVDAGFALTVNQGTGPDLVVNGTLDVNGTIINQGSITSPSGTINFYATSDYNHARNGGTIPTASWDVNSDCNITGINDVTVPVAGFDQTFGNFTWNCPSQAGVPDGNFYMQSDIAIAGNFTVSNTGGIGHTQRSLRMSTDASSYTMTVTGDVLVENDATFKMNNGSGPCIVNVNGDFFLTGGGYFCIVTGNASSALTVAGNVEISGGTMILQEDGNPSTYATWNIGGDFTFSSGIVTELDGSTGDIFFNGTAQSFLRTGGNIQNEVNFQVNSGSILDVGTSLIDESTGSFTLNSNAGIITAHADGLSTTPATGSIQLAGPNTFDSNADYTYNGSAAQVTGDALPGTVRDLTIDNSFGVSLTSGTSVDGTLDLVDGTLTLSTNNLVINPGGSNTGASSSSYVVTDNSGTLKQRVVSSDNLFPIGTPSLYLPITLNNSGADDDYSVYVFADVLDGGATGSTIAEILDCVDATWVVSEDVVGGSNLSVTPQWNETDEGGGFGRADCGVGYHDGSAWLIETTFGSVGGTDPYFRTRNGVLGIGSFSVGEACTRMYDGTVPTITCAADQSQTADPGVCEAVVTVVALGTGDNCGVATVVNEYNGTADASDTYPVGTTPVLWTVTDIHGNINTCTQDITITDDEDPTVTASSDVTANTSDDGTYSRTIEIAIVDAVFSDNCPGSTLAWVMTGATTGSGEGQVGDETFNPGVTTITYTVTDGSANNALDAMTVTVTDDVEIPELFVPEGFSPNGDGFNDRFVILGLENYSQNEFIVFNRQGVEVFRASNYQSDWDGRPKNGAVLGSELFEGTYYYVLTYGDKGIKKGFLYLNRE